MHLTPTCGTRTRYLYLPYALTGLPRPTPCLFAVEPRPFGRSEGIKSLCKPAHRLNDFEIIQPYADPSASTIAVPDVFLNSSQPQIAKDDAHHPEVEEWPSQHLTIWTEIPFVFLLCMAQGATQWGLAMSIVPLHIVGAHFGIDNSPAQESWSPAAYSLTVSVLSLIFSKILNGFH